MKTVVRLLLFACMLLMAALLHGQSGDTAEAVVSRYMKLMNYEALPKDMMLEITSKLVNNVRPDDTMVVRRWFAWPGSHRVEVWEGDSLSDAWHNDGHKSFRRYDGAKHCWIDVSEIYYFDFVMGYDFRGSLFHRKTNGMVLRYGGERLFDGHRVRVVRARVPGMYDRDYMFEESSGLLFLFVELDSSYGDDKPLEENHVDWRSIEEYLPVGGSLVVSKEHYQHHGLRTEATHTPRLAPFDKRLFEQD